MESTYLIAKGILKPWLHTWFRWHLEGIERIPRSGSALIAVNHISYLDPLAMAYAVDKANRVPRFLAKGELFDDKRIAWILKGAKQVEVRRGTADAPMALDFALESLDKGELIVVFPEGTITTDPDLHPMGAKTGIARLALLSRVPVIPAALWGTHNIWPKGFDKQWWPPKQDIMVRLGPPMEISGDAHSPDSWRDAGAKVMAEISKLLASIRPAIPDKRKNKRRAA